MTGDQPRIDPWAWVPALLVAAVALSVSALVMAHGWDGLYGQDAYAYQGYASGELRSALLLLRAPAPFPWPPGFPLLTAIASLATGPTSLAGQLVSLVSGAALPLLTWLLARELAPGQAWSRRATPVLAAAVVAVTPHLWQSAAVVMSDTAALAAMTLGAWALARWTNGGGTRWGIVAAIGCALAIDTRWIYGIAAVPLALGGAIVAWRRAAGAGVLRFLGEAGPAVVAGALVLAPVVGSMLWSAVRAEPVPYSVELDSHAWSVGHLLGRTFGTADGTLSYAWPMLAYVMAQPAQPYHVGPLFAGLTMLGAVAVLRRPAVTTLAILLGWPLAVLAFLAGDVIQNTRFTLAVLPPVAILAACGTRVGATWVGQRLRGTAGVWAVRGAIVIVGVALIVAAVGAWRFTDAFITRFATDRTAVARLAAQVPATDRLIGFQATLQLRHDGRDVLELSDLDPVGAGSLLADGRPTWLLAPANAFGPQWAAARPGAVLAVLAAGPGWHEVGRDGPWRLWQVSEGSTDTPAAGRAGPSNRPGGRWRTVR